MTVLEAINHYALPVLAFFQIVIAVGMLYLNSKFAPKSLEKETATQFEGIEKRVAKMESRLENMPTVPQLHNLEMDVQAVRGDIKRLDENLEGKDGLMARLEKQVNRIEDFLKTVR